MSVEKIVEKISRPKTFGMVEYRRDLCAVTVAELQELYDANPTHPRSAGIKEILDQWGTSGSAREFLVDRQVVIGIAENREVEEICDYAGNREYRTLAVTKKRKAEAAEVKNGEK